MELLDPDDCSDVLLSTNGTDERTVVLGHNEDMTNDTLDNSFMLRLDHVRTQTYRLTVML